VFAWVSEVPLLWQLHAINLDLWQWWIVLVRLRLHDTLAMLRLQRLQTDGVSDELQRPAMPI